MRRLKRTIILLLVFFLAVSSNAFAASATIGNMTTLASTVYQMFDTKDSSLNVTYTGSYKDLTKTKISGAVSSAMFVEDYNRYTLKSYSYSYLPRTTGSSSISMSFTYWESAQEVAYVSQKATEVVSQVTEASMNVHQKVKALHDWVNLNFAYDTTLVSHSAYDGIVNGKTVCQGYALMMYRLLRTAGIEARIVEGKAGSQLHAWNLVKLDSNWYHLDPTWNDPLPDVSGRVKYDYYLLTDTEIRRDHAPSGKYPVANKSYDSALISLKTSDPSRIEFYNQMINLLGLQYLQLENTVKNAAALRTKVLSTVAASGSNFTIRYMSKPSLVPDLAKAFVGTGKGYSYSYYDFKKTSDSKDIILTVTIR